LQVHAPWSHKGCIHSQTTKPTQKLPTTITETSFHFEKQLNDLKPICKPSKKKLSGGPQDLVNQNLGHAGAWWRGGTACMQVFGTLCTQQAGLQQNLHQIELLSPVAVA
jgi:hypothetical protein